MYGAQGIGLCRTEHMFFETERLPFVQAMILAKSPEERAAPLAKLLPFQREDFAGLFKAMDGLPVTIRLIDPPLHEFLPSHDELLRAVAEAEQKVACRAEGRVGRARARAAQQARRRRRRGEARGRSRGRRGQAGRGQEDAGGRRGDARAEPDARPARRPAWHPHARVDSDAGARDLRSGLRLRQGRRRCPSQDHDPADSPQQRAQGPAERARGRGQAGHGREEDQGRLHVRHDDRDPARGAGGRSDRRVCPVLLVRHQRPDPDDLWP